MSIGFAVPCACSSILPARRVAGNTVWDFFFLMFQTGVVVNIGLGWLNLMPIPPLDGSKILWGVLPPKLGFQYMQLERYGFLVLILLLMTGALGYVLYPLIQFSVNTVFSLIVLS
ncbi:MAG: site-2 protease family protein [Bilophila wadsworthia]